MNKDIKLIGFCLSGLIIAGIFVISQNFYVGAHHDPAQPTASSSSSVGMSALAIQDVARQTVEDMNIERRPDLINAFLTGFSGGTVPLSEATGEIREFTLEVTQVMREIAPKVEVEQWAFHFPGEEPTVPGPEIRVKQGDLVRITLRNTHTQPHTIHPHGITSLAMQMDGVEATSFHVLPGEEFTYEFVAATAGTHAYHCHVQTNVHLDMGMYGAIIVEPNDPDFKADREYHITIDEWDADQDPRAAIHATDPDYFLINGKSFPMTTPMEVLEGETGLIRIANVGYEMHSLHLHGMAFLVVAKDGYDLDIPFKGDTLAIGPGERYDIIVNGRDGTFPFHDHIVSSVTNAGVYPGGMLTLIAGSEAKVVTDAEESFYFGKEAKPSRIGAHSHTDTVTTSTETQSVVEQVQAVESLPLLEGNVTINIDQFEYDKKVVRVKPGTTITWVNKDAAPHTITSGLPGEPAATRLFDSSDQVNMNMNMMATDDSWSYTFTELGEIDYYCLPHPFMTGKVLVEN